MSGYSSGFPPTFFEATLQHARPLAGYHLADMWVRFTEARLTVLTVRPPVSQATTRPGKSSIPYFNLKLTKE
eukprot:829847-Rhodomonas_salina.1